MSQKFTILYLLRSILVKIYPRFEIRSSLSRNRRDEFSRREIPPFLISGISMPRRVRQGIPALSARRGEREREREREREKERKSSFTSVEPEERVSFGAHRGLLCLSWQQRVAS